jgi:hypothetical protein
MSQRIALLGHLEMRQDEGGPRRAQHLRAEWRTMITVGR